MTVYRLVALLADQNTFSRVNPQVYQTRGILATKVTLHTFSFLALATHKKGGILRHTGQEYPYKKHKKAATAAFLCVVVSVKRS
jgi:hypothetical protein